MQSENTQSSEQYNNFEHKLLAFLTALCLFFSAVELVIPKPFPFLRLGLANLPVILSLFFLSAPQFFLLILLKIFVQNLISGTIFSYTILFSIAGSTASALIMFLLYKLFYNKNLISIIGISTAGALFNSLAQLGISYLCIFNENTKYIAPIFLASSFITGILLGIAVTIFTKHSQWFSKITSQISQTKNHIGETK